MSGSDNGTRFRNLLPWVIAGVAVLALAANLLLGREARDAPGSEAIAELNERLAALESSPPQARQQGRSARPLVAPNGPGGESASGRSEEPQTAEEIAAARNRQLRELEARFASDPPDPVTGPDTENLLVETISGEAMAGTGLRPSDVDIACRRESCRIVGSFDRMGDAQDWGLFYITAAGGNVLSQAQMVFVPLPGGRFEVRIYSSRAKD